MIKINYSKMYIRFALLLAALLEGMGGLYSQSTQTYSTSGTYTWTCPNGVTSATVECFGAGGCGSRRSSTGQGGGGGGGAYASSVVAVTAGTNYVVIVGGGGDGTSGSPSDGGNSTFNGTAVVAAGGASVANNSTTGGSGGLASSSAGTTKYDGGSGGSASGGNSGGGGGGAGSGGSGGVGSAGNGSGGGTGTNNNPDGSGGNGRNGNGNGNSGNAYGGGGGGSSRSSGTKNGGNGADGAVIIAYCLPALLSTQPASYTTTTGSASFNIVANNIGSTTYQWQYSTDGGTTFNDITSSNIDPSVTQTNYTTATLSLSNITCGANGYKYRCNIINCGGLATSNVATLTYSIPITISTQPASYTTQSVATFSVAAYTAGGDALTYQWQRNNGSWANITSSGMDAGVIYADYTTSVLELMNVTGTVNNYKYRCVVSNNCGTMSATSNSATLSYNSCPSVTISVQPANTTILYAGSGAVFHVNSLGGDAYQWQRSTDGGSTWVDISSSNTDYGVTYSNYTTATLNLNNVTNSVNGYKYRCIITSASSNCSVVTDGTATLTYSAANTCNTQYKRQLQIYKNNIPTGGDLTNFPFMINLTDASLKAHMANSNGYDILFTDASGTPLYFELESYNSSTGALLAWINIPTLSSSTTTTVYMYYGNSSATTNPSSSLTWDTNFVAVYHFNNYNDATAYNFNGSNSGTSITATNAMIGNSVTTFSPSGYIRVSGDRSSEFNNDVLQKITVSAWARIGSRGNDQKICGSEDGTNGGWKMGVYTDNTLEFEIRNGGSAILNRSYGSPITTWTTNTWYHTAGQYSYSPTSGFIKTYVNGTLDRGTYATTTAMALTTSTMAIGCEAYSPGSAEWTGMIDEIHISNCIRSAGWIAAEYYNQKNSSPSTTTYSLLPEIAITNSVTGNWASGSTWTGGSVPSATADVTINTGTVTIAATATVNSITIKSGTTLNIASGQTLFISSFVMNCGGVLSGAGTLAMTGTTTTQNISGTGTYSVGNLVINNTAATTPTISLQAPVSVTNSLTLTKGLLNTDVTNILTLQSGATTASLTANGTSYINGPLKYQKATSGLSTLNFPIGNGADCRPITLIVNHTDNTSYNYTAQLYNVNPWAVATSTYTDMPSTVDTISGVHYWKIDRTNASGVSTPSTGLVGTQQIALHFGTNDKVYQGKGLTVVKSTSGNSMPWIDIGKANTYSVNGTDISSSTTTYTNGITGYITSASSGAPSNFNSFSMFTIGSSLNPGYNPLPIELLSFTARPNDNKVNLKWVTAQEINNNYFTVEKSKDGKTFTKVIDVLGAGNSHSQIDYFETDYQPYEGTSYYRLKQTDYNGKYTYSNVVTVIFASGGGKSITFYPNPVEDMKDLNIKTTGHKGDEVLVVLQDIQGKEYFSKVYLVDDDLKLLAIDEAYSIPPGTYIVIASSSDKVYNQKIIVRGR